MSVLCFSSPGEARPIANNQLVDSSEQGGDTAGGFGDGTFGHTCFQSQSRQRSMGSKFIRICSVDVVRIRRAFGSGDRKILNMWLRAIRKRGKAVQNSEDVIEAEEEAAEQLIAGGFAEGENADGHHFVYSLQTLCELWADDSGIVECAISAECPALMRLVGVEAATSFGVPSSPSGILAIYQHDSSEIHDLRAAFAATREAEGVEDFISLEDIDVIDRVLRHAQQAGRGVIVFYLG
jgi:hypothetical protein